MSVNTKLTLSVDAAVIRQAKAVARQRSKSLSRLVEEYLRFVSTESEHTPPISNGVLTVADSLDLPPGATYDNLKEQYLRDKLLGGERAQDTHAPPLHRAGAISLLKGNPRTLIL